MRTLATNERNLSMKHISPGGQSEGPMHSAEEKYIVLFDFKKIFSGEFVRGGRGRTFGEHPVAKAERRARRTISDIIFRDSGVREEQGWYAAHIKDEEKQTKL